MFNNDNIRLSKISNKIYNLINTPFELTDDIKFELYKEIALRFPLEFIAVAYDSVNIISNIYFLQIRDDLLKLVFLESYHIKRLISGLHIKRFNHIFLSIMNITYMKSNADTFLNTMPTSYLYFITVLVQNNYDQNNTTNIFTFINSLDMYEKIRCIQFVCKYYNRMANTRLSNYDELNIFHPIFLSCLDFNNCNVTYIEKEKLTNFLRLLVVRSHSAIEDINNFKNSDICKNNMNTFINFIKNNIKYIIEYSSIIILIALIKEFNEIFDIDTFDEILKNISNEDIILVLDVFYIHNYETIYLDVKFKNLFHTCIKKRFNHDASITDILTRKIQTTFNNALVPSITSNLLANLSCRSKYIREIGYDHIVNNDDYYLDEIKDIIIIYSMFWDTEFMDHKTFCNAIEDYLPNNNIMSYVLEKIFPLLELMNDNQKRVLIEEIHALQRY